MKPTELKVQLEIPAWEKIITILKSCTVNKAVKFYPPCITIKTSKPKRGFSTKTSRIIQEQSPRTCSLLIVRSELERYPDTIDLAHGNTDLACVAKYQDELLDITTEGNISQASERSKYINTVNFEGEYAMIQYKDKISP